MKRAAATLQWMRSRSRPRVVVGAATLLVVLAVATSFAQTQPPSGIARTVSVQGTVEVRRTGTVTWQPVRLNDTFSAGDTVRVGGQSRADLQLLDQSVLRLNADTELTVEPVKDQRIRGPASSTCSSGFSAHARVTYVVQHVQLEELAGSRPVERTSGCAIRRSAIASRSVTASSASAPRAGHQEFDDRTHAVRLRQIHVGTSVKLRHPVTSTGHRRDSRLA
jgi:uncharacterized protein YaiE (UPF0345 family)